MSRLTHSPDSTSSRADPKDLHIDIEAVEQATPRPAPKTESSMGPGNAYVQEETKAHSRETFGALNQHPSSSPATPSLDDGPAQFSEPGSSRSAGSEGLSGSNGGPEQPNGMPPPYKVGVSVDRNRKCRRTMEDAHSFIYDFGGIRGQGYFAVFDGHAGKHAAEWCGGHFHEHLLRHLHPATSASTSSTDPPPIPEILNKTFHSVDLKLSELATVEGTHSGCTAVTVFLRLEGAEGNPVGVGGGVGTGVEVLESQQAEGRPEALEKGVQGVKLTSNELFKTPGDEDESGGVEKKKGLRETLKDVVRGKMGGSSSSASSPTASSPNLSTATPSGGPPSATVIVEIDGTEKEVPRIPTPSVKINGPAEIKQFAQRTLYTANVGDARAVLCRAGKAVRLTYDHKGSDAKEAKRITDAGGFVMNNRVNGVLAVTRSLGDASMKEFVVGSPYTTETTLGPQDEYLIVACDGLWDVCQDQQAVDIIKGLSAQDASKALLDHALGAFSNDNLSVLVVSLR